MHICDTIDDSLSGTTAVGVLLDCYDMYIANVSVIVQLVEMLGFRPGFKKILTRFRENLQLLPLFVEL